MKINRRTNLLVKIAMVTCMAAFLTINMNFIVKAVDPLMVPSVEQPTTPLMGAIPQMGLEAQPQPITIPEPVVQPEPQPVEKTDKSTPSVTSHSIDNADAKKKDIDSELDDEQVFDEDREVEVEENRKVYPKWQSKRKREVKDYDYSIKVNKSTNTVTVYIVEEDGKLTPFKAMVCSIGREGHETPEGKGYKTSDYYDWRLMVDNTYGRYAVRFNGSIMFHSVPYYESKKNSLEWKDYNKLGRPASLGCVRLAVADAKWIFDNCRRGTEVEVYSGPKSTDPLGTPEPIKLDTNSEYRDWDPTDLTPENPWLVPVE